MGAGVASSLLVDVTRPSRALLFGAGLWFLVMLFARWTTYAYFAGVAPVVLPFLDNKDVPRRARENAVLALMRSIGKDGPEFRLVKRHVAG